jgi:hypothetical protein
VNAAPEDARGIQRALCHAFTPMTLDAQAGVLAAFIGRRSTPTGSIHLGAIAGAVEEDEMRQTLRLFPCFVGLMLVHAGIVAMPLPRTPQVSGIAAAFTGGSPATDDETGQSKLLHATRLFDAKQYSDALPLFQELARDGNPEAATRLGFMYTLGLGVTQN